MKKYFRFILIMSLALCLIGCSSEKEEFEKYVKDMEEVLELELELSDKMTSYAENPTESTKAEMQKAFDKLSDQATKAKENAEDISMDGIHSCYDTRIMSYDIFMRGIISYVEGNMTESKLDSLAEALDGTWELYKTSLKDMADIKDVDVDYLIELYE